MSDCLLCMSQLHMNGEHYEESCVYIHPHGYLFQPLHIPQLNCIVFPDLSFKFKHSNDLHFMILHHTDDHAGPIIHEMYTSNFIF